jgi:hypothetical protein
MSKKLKVRSPTGIIHYVNSYHKGIYTTLCGHTNPYENDEYVPEWIETERSVTCKRCLRQELLNETKNDKCDVHICHSYIDPRKDAISISNISKSNLLKVLISQGHVTKPLEKDEQILIAIYKE